MEMTKKEEKKSEREIDLEQTIDTLKKRMSEYEFEYDKKQKQVKFLEEENKKLKEENERLKSEGLQLKIEKIDYEFPDLERGDVVIFGDEKHGLQLGIIKSNYVDHNTDYSWNYVQTGSKEVGLNREKGKEILEDIYTPDIYCKITGEGADKLREWIDYNLL